MITIATEMPVAEGLLAAALLLIAKANSAN